MLSGGIRAFEARRRSVGGEVAPLVATIEGRSTGVSSWGRVGETSIRLHYSVVRRQRTITLR